jgi:hypothetical protein
MKRIISVFAVVAVMAAILVASAMPVFASAEGNPNAGCFGQSTSAVMTQEHGPAQGLEFARVAQEDGRGTGEFRGTTASSPQCQGGSTSNP